MLATHTSSHVASQGQRRLSSVGDIGHLRAETEILREFCEKCFAPGQPCPAIDHVSTFNPPNKLEKASVQEACDPVLTVQQKVEIVTSRLDTIKTKNFADRAASEKLIDTLLAAIEETNLRISDLKRDAGDLKNALLDAGDDEMNASSILRFMETKNRQSDDTIRILRLKKASLSAQRNKIKEMLQQKKERGGALRYIDYYQLQIENKKLKSSLEEKNKQLFALRAKESKASEALQVLKVTIDSDEKLCAREISTYAKHAQRLERSIAKIKEEIEAEKRCHLRLRRRAATRADEKEITSEMPKTMEYVEQKAHMYELRDEIKRWERKVEMAEMAYRKHRAEGLSGNWLQDS